MNKKTGTIFFLACGIAAGIAVVYPWVRRKGYSGLKLKRSIVIHRPADELYRFWHDFSNLPLLVDSLESVVELGGSRSLWNLKAPAVGRITWNAEITIDHKDEVIGWRSVHDSPIETAGYVRFLPAPGDRGTLVRVALEYYPPAGRIGAGLAAILGRRPGRMVEEALRRFKQLMETGDIPRGEAVRTDEALPERLWA